MIDLNKVQQHAPSLVNLTKQAAVSIEKAGLKGHTASVLLVLDVSASTDHLYYNRSMQKVADQAFVMALNFDDDGEVPVCMFESRAHDRGILTLENHTGFIDKARGRLSGGTNYTQALQWCRKAATPDTKKRGVFSRKHDVALPAQHPTYVLFVTDGEPTDSRYEIEQQLIESSREPIFFQFIGVGNHNFEFLKRLDRLQGGLIDNANFFAVKDPKSFSDEDMFNSLLAEYPLWVPQAQHHGLIV